MDIKLGDVQVTALIPVAEGLFMYFSLEEIAKLLPKMNDRWATFKW